jgi:hypothetical protein
MAIVSQAEGPDLAAPITADISRTARRPAAREQDARGDGPVPLPEPS